MTIDLLTPDEIIKGEVIKLRTRSRWRRALFVPNLLMQYRKMGLSWQASLLLAHWCVWFKPSKR